MGVTCYVLIDLPFSGWFPAVGHTGLPQQSTGARPVFPRVLSVA